MRTAVWQGVIRIGTLDLKVAVLDDGTRIIEQESLMRFFESDFGLADPLELRGLVAFTIGEGVPPGETPMPASQPVREWPPSEGELQG
jgi:hypothetical protein